MLTSNAVRSGTTAESCGILMYHRVTPLIEGMPSPTWNVTPERLHEQLSGLMARGFRPISLSELLRFIQRGRSLPRRSFVVTFDDGYANFYTDARPVLQTLSIPSTIFVATAYLDNKGPFPFDDWVAAGDSRVPAQSWKPISSEQCAALGDDPLIEVGTHTHVHADFRQRIHAFYQDLKTSMQTLQRITGLRRRSLAFPFGFVNRDLVAAAHTAGVSCGLTIQRRLVSLQTDRLSFGRFEIGQRDSVEGIAKDLCGQNIMKRRIHWAIRWRYSRWFNG